MVVPWALYQRTGDQGVLERQLPSMRAWVDKAASQPTLERLTVEVTSEDGTRLRYYLVQ
ncbi:hypothetical protein a10_02338 [Streptomyces acidiscabies]|nr:hypothetical protein a10_02338 [Streptomyces acidiscabies]